jgi:hypothetical protein
MCRRPPDGADLPPHYKHGRPSRPQPFAGAATVARATDLDTKNVKVFSDGANWESVRPSCKFGSGSVSKDRGAGAVENSSSRTKRLIAPAPGWKLLICRRYPVAAPGHHISQGGDGVVGKSLQGPGRDGRRLMALERAVLIALRRCVEALRAWPCDMVHESIPDGPGGDPMPSERSPSGFARTGLCPEAGRATNLACSHTMARYVLRDAIMTVPGTATKLWLPPCMNSNKRSACSTAAATMRKADGQAPSWRTRTAHRENAISPLSSPNTAPV